MSARNPDADSPDTKLEERINNLEKGLAAIDGRIVGSWAMHTREQYEKEFRGEVKDGLVRFATVFLGTVVLFLLGSGYVLLKGVVDSSVDSKYQATIDGVKKSLEDRYQNQISWQTEHNTGVARRQLAEFYYRIGCVSKEPDLKNESNRQVEVLIRRATRSFEEALKINDGQATSYWELGELNFVYPERFGQTFDRDIALQKYQAALSRYTDFEKRKGWMAECYARIGEILVYKAERSTLSEEKRKLTAAAKENLNFAIMEFDTAAAGKVQNRPSPVPVSTPTPQPSPPECDPKIHPPTKAEAQELLRRITLGPTN